MNMEKTKIVLLRKHLHKLACLITMLIVSVLYVQAETNISYSFSEGSYADDCDTSTMHMMWDRLKVIKDFETVLNDPFNEAHHLDLNGNGIIDSIRIIAIQKEDPVELLLQACIAKNLWADVATMYIVEKSANISGDADFSSADDGYKDISMNLSLEAVLVSLYESNSLYAFEEKLNSSLHLSNIDCNNDGLVDNLFVEEFIEDGLHMICINAMFSALEYQEIACIYGMKLPQNNRIEIEIIGNPYIFGNNCIVRPYWYNNPAIFREIFTYRSPYNSHRDGISYGNKTRWSTNHYQDEMRNYISMHSYLINDFSYPAVLSGFFFMPQRSHYSAYETHSPNRAYHKRNNTDSSKNAYSEKQSAEPSTTPIKRSESVSASDNTSTSSVRSGAQSTSGERSVSPQGIPTTRSSADTIPAQKTTSPSIRRDAESTFPTQQVFPSNYTKEPSPQTKTSAPSSPAQKPAPVPTTNKPQPQKSQTPVQQSVPKTNKPVVNKPQPANPQPTVKIEQKQQNPQSNQSSQTITPTVKTKKK